MIKRYKQYFSSKPVLAINFVLMLIYTVQYNLYVGLYVISGVSVLFPLITGVIDKLMDKKE